MNFNTFVMRFGLSPEDFIVRDSEPIKTEDGFIYEVYQREDKRLCPGCGSSDCWLHSHYPTEKSFTINSQLLETLRIIKPRFKCNQCGRTFTMPLKGIEGRKSIPDQIEDMICGEFYKTIPFSQIGQMYNFSTARILQIFDDRFPFVPRKQLPRVLCIDEKKFSDETGSKYCCILYDFISEEVVDVLRSRRLDFLEDYFSSISEKERDGVKVFVSDMNDGYAACARRYFPKATHIIDLFHVVKLFTSAVDSLRIKAMKRSNKKSLVYRFMKRHWKLFLCRSRDIPDKFFSDKRNSCQYHYDDMIFKCIKSDADLLCGYNILQDFYNYYQKNNFDEALKFLEFMIIRMKESGIEELIKVSASLKKWKAGIAVSIARSQNRIHYSNSAAENDNSHIELLIRVSYGYRNFERFRKRVLLIRGEKPDKKK